MKVPPLIGFSRMVLPSKLSPIKQMRRPVSQNQTDTVSFGSNKSRYYRKYSTLPDEIKSLLSPQDAFDMFQDMEFVAAGAKRGKKVYGDEVTGIYKNPWLENYYFLVLKNKPEADFSGSKNDFGNIIWQDSDNTRIQIMHVA